MKRRITARGEERKRGADHERQSLATEWLKSPAKHLLTLNHQAEKFLDSRVIANNISNFWQAVFLGGLNWVRVRAGTIHLYRKPVSNMGVAAWVRGEEGSGRLAFSVQPLLERGVDVVYHWSEEEVA